MFCFCLFFVVALSKRESGNKSSSKKEIEKVVPKSKPVNQTKSQVPNTKSKISNTTQTTKANETIKESKKTESTKSGAKKDETHKNRPKIVPETKKASKTDKSGSTPCTNCSSGKSWFDCEGTKLRDFLRNYKASHYNRDYDY